VLSTAKKQERGIETGQTGQGCGHRIGHGGAKANWTKQQTADGRRQTAEKVSASFFSAAPHRTPAGIILGPVYDPYAMLRRLPLLLTVLLAAPSYAYIPALNSTAEGVANTENSTITLKWPSGTFSETISYQLAASGSMGISKVCISLADPTNQVRTESALGGARARA